MKSSVLVCAVLLLVVASPSAGQSEAEANAGSKPVVGQAAQDPRAVRSQPGPRALDEARDLARRLETALAEFHAARTRYPKLGELGAIPPRPPSVRSVRVGATGASNIPAMIELDLASSDLGGHRVYFLLRADLGPSSWECVSTDIASIARLLPNCAYAPGYVPPQIEVLPLQRAWQALYEGTVGGSPVVVLFWQVTQTTSTARDPAVAVEGLYYYRRRGRTLALLRAPDRRKLVECPESFWGEEACPQPTGIWQVDVTEGRVSGTWRPSSDGPSKAVTLARRASGKSSPRDPYDVYRDMQHEGRRRAVAAEARREGIVWRTERRGSGVGGLTGRIVLLESPDAAARQRINGRLASSVHSADSPADCEKHSESCDDGNDIDVVFANKRLFAIAGSSYWSGGAHPTNGFSAITFDLQSGEEIDWRHILRVTDATAGGGHAAATSIDLRRDDLLASHVLRAAMKEKDGCSEVIAEYYGCAGGACAKGPEPEADTWIFYPTIDGLAVSPQIYDEAQRGCREESIVVPWTDVHKTLLRSMILP